MTFDQVLERVAEGKPVTFLLASDGPYFEACPWCIPFRGAEKANVCEVACPGSTPMCAQCLEMYTPGESDEEIESAQARCHDAVEAAAFPDALASGAARALGRLVKWTLAAINLVAVVFAVLWKAGVLRAFVWPLVFVAFTVAVRGAMSL